jgi:glutamate-1-semialdehyde 2,1-aminomutase
VKFEGCYHGHADYLLVKAGSGAATFGVPDSAGVPAQRAPTRLTLPYNDVAALRALFAARGHRHRRRHRRARRGQHGRRAARAGLPRGDLALCAKHGAVSIFDEVMTGCRVARGGMQERVGLRPDMTCLGKIVGGGMPLAAYGGKRAIMEKVAPLGPVYQAGTLSGNPVAVSAALATLEHLDDALYARLEALSARLEGGLVARHREARGGGVRAARRLDDHAVLHAGARALVERREGERHEARFGAGTGGCSSGQYWPPAQFEAAFVSGAHTEADIESLAAVRASHS